MEVIGMKLKIKNTSSFNHHHFKTLKCMLNPLSIKFNGGEVRGDNYASSDDIFLQYHNHIEVNNVLTIEP